jgi:hypothetical protein
MRAAADQVKNGGFCVPSLTAVTGRGDPTTQGDVQVPTAFAGQPVAAAASQRQPAGCGCKLGAHAAAGASKQSPAAPRPGGASGMLQLPLLHDSCMWAVAATHNGLQDNQTEWMHKMLGTASLQGTCYRRTEANWVHALNVPISSVDHR